MSDFITEIQLKKIIENQDGSLSKLSAIIKTEVSKILLERKDFDSSVFISHNHKDIELVEYFIAFLTNLNIDVYVDWLDDALTYPPSDVTAKKIKKMIKANEKFIFLATNEAIESKWCNWELGLGDVHKYDKNIVLMPIAKNNGDWIGNEYLQIYPYVDKKYKGLDNGFNVIFPNGLIVDFEEWLKQDSNV